MKALLKALVVFVIITLVGYSVGWVASSQGFNPQQFSFLGKFSMCTSLIAATIVSLFIYGMESDN